MELTRTAPASTPSMRALALVGRVVTDGVRVGVMRTANGPDWFVVADESGTVQLHTTDLPWASSPEPECEVRWDGAAWTSVVPLADVRKGVTLFKAYGLPRF